MLFGLSGRLDFASVLVVALEGVPNAVPRECCWISVVVDVPFYIIIKYREREVIIVYKKEEKIIIPVPPCTTTTL